jgi:hypothetical protein
MPWLEIGAAAVATCALVAWIWWPEKPLSDGGAEVEESESPAAAEVPAENAAPEPPPQKRKRGRPRKVPT